jgi:microcystin-dependent protein
MATNSILTFAATGTTADLLTDGEYSADAQRGIGHQPGVARAKLANKVAKQSSLLSAALAQFIADNQSNNISDSLSVATLAGYLDQAVAASLLDRGFVIIGEVRYVCQPSPPAGWLKANGVAISRTTYAALFGALGTLYGAGDGSTTFNLPDLRGEFIRGFDDGRGVDPARSLGTKQKGTLIGYDKSNDAVFGVSTTTDFGSASQAVVGVDPYSTADYAGANLRGATDVGSNALPGNADGASGGYSGVARPRNIALLPIIYTGVV